MKTLTFILLVLSLAETALWFVPISSELMWPAGMIVREIWPWAIAANVLGILFAIFRWRWAILVFAGGLAVTLWPLAQIRDLENDIADQWEHRGFSAASLHVPGTFGVLLRSFTDVDPVEPDIAPNTLRPDIYLYKSPDSVGLEPLPIVVNIHGGSWQHLDASADARFTSHLATEGYAVFSIDYSKAPIYQYPAQINDVRAAIDWIVANAPFYGADPTRIAVIGRSAGAQLALLYSYTNEAIPIRGVVSLYGPTDLMEMHRNPPSPDPIDVRAKLEAYLGGTPDDVPAAYRDASPIAHLKANLPPTLLIQGARDHVVEPGFTEEMHQRLKESGTRSVLIELPWSDHSFDSVYFGPGNILANAYIEAFLADIMPPNAQPIAELSDTPPAQDLLRKDSSSSS